MAIAPSKHFSARDSSDPTYRPDIDGLRAVAVLAVLGYHAVPGRIQGGFVGVDVFFVISGFLITSIILRGAEAGSFSFWGFYARRIRRIFPALIVVLLATLAIGWCTLLPDEYEQLGLHVVSGALFSSNFLLWSQVGYFDTDASLKPLLHLWSLGIEEQFYLLWPATVIAIWKFRRHRTYLIAAIAVSSFAINVYYVKSNPAATFYSPVSRYWELMIGALLATAFLRGDFIGNLSSRLSLPRAENALRNVTSVIGIALILGSILLFGKEVEFPGWNALVPTTGTALVIAAGPTTWMNQHLLSKRFVVFIGLISYPLYLWHWPLLSYVAIYQPESTVVLRTLKAAALLGSFVAAATTYRLLELPLRGLQLKKTAYALALSMTIVVFFGGTVTLAGGIPKRFNAHDRMVIANMNSERKAFDATVRRGSCFLNLDQSENDFSEKCRASVRPKIFLWGDSHAAALYSGLRGLVPSPDQDISQYTTSACPPVLQDNSSFPRNCGKINQRVASEVRSQSPDILVLDALWTLFYKSDNFLPSLAETIRRMRSSAKEIILVGPDVAFNKTQAKYILGTNGSTMAPNSFLPELRAADDVLRRIAREQNVQYISPVSSLCRDGKCRIVLPGAGPPRLLDYDYGHLTRNGSSFYAREFFGPVIKKMRNP